jgi:iron(III) transport system substrate-binding protein
MNSGTTKHPRRTLRNPRILIAMAGVLAIPLVSACSGPPADTGADGGGGNEYGIGASWSEIEELANQEGELILYTTAADDVNLPEIEAFNQAYPDITVVHTRLPASEMTARYSSEHEAGAPTADLIRMANSLVFDANPDWFIPLDTTILPNLENVPEQYVKPQYVAPLAAELLFTRNTDLLPESDVPSSWEDIVDLADSTKGILWDPRAAATFASFYQHLRDLYGDEFLTELGASGQTFASTIGDSMQASAAGQGAWVIPGQDAHSKELRESGAPLEISPMTPSMGPVYAVGIDNTAAHPNAALVYLNWTLSNDGPGAACQAGLVATFPNTNPDCTGELPDDFFVLDDAKGQEELDKIVSLLGLS